MRWKTLEQDPQAQDDALMFKERLGPLYPGTLRPPFCFVSFSACSALHEAIAFWPQSGSFSIATATSDARPVKVIQLPLIRLSDILLSAAETTVALPGVSWA